MHVHLRVRQAQPRERPLRGAGHSRRQVEHLHDSGALGRRVRGLTTRDDVGRDPALAVRRTGQGHDDRLAGDGVDDLHRVADGEDVGIGGAHALVHEHGAPVGQLEPRGAGERGLRSDADREDDQVGGDLLGSEVDDHPAIRIGEADGRRGQQDADPLGPHVRLEMVRHLGVEHGHDLVERLDEGDLQPAMGERLDHLDADVAAADDDRRARVILEQLDDAVHVRDAAQRADARVVDAGDRGAQGRRAGREDERVVRLGVHLAGASLADRDLLGVAVDREHLVPCAHVEGEGLTQALRRLQEQGVALLDVSADVVREPAVRERHVVVPLEDDDLGVLIQAAQAGCSRHPAGDSADDDDLHG